MIIDYISGIGLDAVKDRIHDEREEQILRDRLNTYIQKQAKINYHCTLEEEIDFGKLADYIRSDLIEDVQDCLFGNRKERGAARTIIIKKAISYSQAHTSLTRQRATKLIGTAIDVLRDFYKGKTNRELKFIAAQIEDTVIEAISVQAKEVVHTAKSSEQTILKELGDKLENNATMSIEKNMLLMNSGEIKQVEGNLTNFINAIGTTHILFPDYRYELKGETRQFYSKPLTRAALEKYPPSISCTGTIQINGKYVNKFDVNTINYANRHQFPITLNVITAKKFLGDIVDPVQQEAENLIGKKITIPPVPFPPAFPCSISLDGNIYFDYIMFRTEEILDDDTIIISNREQDNCPYRITMAIDIHTYKTRYSVNTIEPTNEDLLQYLRFLKQASSGAMISIKVLSAGEELAHGKLDNLDYKSGFDTLEIELDFLEKIVIIEHYFGKSINIPKDITQEDFQLISYVSALIQGEECTGRWSKLEFTLSLTEDLQKRIKVFDNSKFVLSYVSSISVNIFCENFEFSTVRKFDSVIYQNLERLKQKAEVLDIGDSIKMSFLPGEGENGTWRDRLNTEYIK